MTTPRASASFAAAAAIAAAGSFLIPVPAHADTLPNGLTVSCNKDSDIQVTCIIGGCPRVHGDYVVDAVHVMYAGTQDEYEFKCINGQTARWVGQWREGFPETINVGVQGCRKKDLEGDWCGPWSNYAYKPPAPKPAGPPPKPADIQCPPGSEKPTVPAGQQCKAAPKPKVKCPEGSPTPEVEEGQQCAAIPPVTNAIQASFTPQLGNMAVKVTNTSKLNAKCTYDSHPFDTHRDFNLGANSNTSLNFGGFNTGTNYHVVISCHDASGKQSEELGRVEQDVRF